MHGGDRKPKYLVMDYSGFGGGDYAKWLEDTEKNNPGYECISDKCYNKECRRWTATFVYRGPVS